MTLPTGHAEAISKILNSAVALLKASTRTYLAALDDKYIEIGAPAIKEFRNGAYIEPVRYDEEWETTQQKKLELEFVAVVTVANTDPSVSFTELNNLAGDVADELVALATTELEGNARITHHPGAQYSSDESGTKRMALLTFRGEITFEVT